MRSNINFVALDFETATKDAVCQIGLCVVKEGVIVKEVCQLIQPPGNKYNKSAIAVHQIKPEMTKDAPTFGEFWPEIVDYIDHNVIVCHNKSFDLTILNKEIFRYGLDPIHPMAEVCTYRLTDMKLVDACSYYGVRLDNNHDALEDARACANLFIEYLTSGKEQPEFEIDHEEIQTDIEKKREAMISRFMSIEHDGHDKIESKLLVKDLTGADPENPFYDKKVVITGVFDMDRNEIAARLQKLGADVNTAISRKTDIVLTGYDAGPAKLEKIADLRSKGYDIKQYDADETIKLLTQWEKK